MKTVLTLFALLFTTSLFAQDDLDNYIKRLKNSQATGGSETSFMSAGSEFMYGQGYFEKGTYDMAEMYFARARQMDSTNPYFNYQLAISLLKQKDKYKAQQAQPFLQKAFSLNSSLQQRYAVDMPQAAAPQKEKETFTNRGNNTGNNSASNKPQGLHAYIEELKYSRATGGAKTAMLTAGQEVMYGYDYYERQDYESAEQRFRYAVTKAPDDAYANYLLAVSLAAQGKKSDTYLATAVAGDPSLRAQFGKDVAAANAAHAKIQAAKKPATTPSAPRKTGGALTYGNYMCSQTVWNGPNSSPAFSPQRQGYFTLNKDGTYRWLDNGKVGRYSYDAKTGNIKWLSGHLAASAPKSSVYQPGEKVAQITINFSEDYRWECGCNK